MGGYVKLLAPPFVVCPKCHEMNDDKKGRLWIVADERGTHHECDTCAHVWTPEAREA